VFSERHSEQHSELQLLEQYSEQRAYHCRCYRTFTRWDNLEKHLHTSRCDEGKEKEGSFYRCICGSPHMSMEKFMLHKRSCRSHCRENKSKLARTGRNWSSTMAPMSKDPSLEALEPRTPKSKLASIANSSAKNGVKVGTALQMAENHSKEGEGGIAEPVSFSLPFRLSNAMTHQKSRTPEEVENYLQLSTAPLSPSLQLPHSDSEISSLEGGDDEEILSREEKKSLLLDRLMSYFFGLFASCRSPYPLSRTAHGDARGTSQNAGDSAGPSVSLLQRPANGSSSSTSNDSHRRKRPHDDENNDGGDGRGQKRLLANDSTLLPPKRLACPYFKKDSERFQSGRACSGPGWETVHRVKSVRPYRPV
jgi:hypothetical protein